MPIQTANVMVAIGGDRGNSVPKTVTPGEIAMLQAIHGPDAVYDIEPTNEPVDRNNAEELGRLRAIYGAARNEEGASLIASVYPGVGAQVPTKLSALGLPSDLMKPKTRATTDETTAAPAVGSLAYRETPGATGYEPIEVPADPDTSDLPDETGMQDPRLQPQIDLPPGLAAATIADVKGAIVEKAENLEAARKGDTKSKAKNDPFK